MSVVTRDQIDLLNFIDVQQAVRYTAGIVGENYGPDLRFDFLTLRGFTPTQYIDGVQAPLTTTISNVGADLYGFESLEILKGPSAVLYGASPPGGIYNLTSRRASNEFGGELGVKYGEHDYKQVEGTITGPLANGLDARLTGLYRDRDSQVDGVHARRAFVAPTLTWQPRDGTRITALGYYQHDRVDGDTNGFLPIFGVQQPNPLGEVPRSTNLGEPDYNFYERNQFGVGYELKQEIGDRVDFVSNAKWFRYKELQHVIYGAGLLDGNFDGVPDDYRTVNRFNFPYRERVNEFAVDNRLAARLDSGPIEHRLLAGIDYRNTRNDAQFGFASATPIDLFNPVYSSGPITTPAFFPYVEQRVKQTGVYAQEQAKIGGLVLTAAGRYDWVRTDNAIAATSDEDHKFTYRVGANYVLDNGIAPYVSYATSFQPIVGVDPSGNSFAPSSGKQLEAGVKYDARSLLPDVRLFATGSVFRIVQDNVVINAGSQINTSIQAKRAVVKGVELEAVARIRNQLTINASYTYTDSEITRTAAGGPPVGAELPTTPKNKASLLVDYTLQRGTLGGLGFGAGVRYVGSSPGSILGPFNSVVYRNDASTLFDALIHYDLPDWRFAVNGSNVLDKKYVGRCASATNCIYGQARQVIASVTRKF